MALTDASDPQLDARRRRTVVWVVGLATLGLLFDGYDLVVYGAVVPTFLRYLSQIGHVSPAMAGALGSYALFGVLVGALLAGTVGDIIVWWRARQEPQPRERPSRRTDDGSLQPPWGPIGLSDVVPRIL